MKFKVTLKDPDGVFDAVEDVVNEAEDLKNLHEQEAEAAATARKERLRAFMGAWVEYGEYVTVEFDTEAGTARVVPLKE